MLQLLHATGGGTCHRGHLGIVKVTLDLRGCPRGKNSYTRHFKGKHGMLYIVGSLINVDFGNKYELPVSSILQKKIINNHENSHVSFN